MVTPEEMEKFEEFLQRYMDNANAGGVPMVDPGIRALASNNVKPLRAKPQPATSAAQQEIISRDDEERSIDSASLPPLSNPPIKEMGFVSPHSTMPGMAQALSAQPTAGQRADIQACSLPSQR